MINSCVSQQSIAKQILVNNLRLIPDLSNVVKEFIFYDKVTQASRDVKNHMVNRMNLVFDTAAGIYEDGIATASEGYGTMTITGELVRYRHTAIRCLDSNNGIQFIICYKCGNYILSESSIAPQILCNCGLVNLIDDEVEEEEDVEEEEEEEVEEEEEEVRRILLGDFLDEDEEEEYRR
jgi:hypothetical protein